QRGEQAPKALHLFGRVEAALGQRKTLAQHPPEQAVLDAALGCPTAIHPHALRARLDPTQPLAEQAALAGALVAQDRAQLRRLIRHRSLEHAVAHTQLVLSTNEARGPSQNPKRISSGPSFHRLSLGPGGVYHLHPTAQAFTPHALTPQASRLTPHASSFTPHASRL